MTAIMEVDLTKELQYGHFVELEIRNSQLENLKI